MKNLAMEALDKEFESIKRVHESLQSKLKVLSEERAIFEERVRNLNDRIKKMTPDLTQYPLGEN